MLWSPEMADDCINTIIANGVASVVMNNPRAKNSLTRTMCIELAELMQKLDRDPVVTLITLRGAGTTFSAGAAIGELASILLDPQGDGSTLDHLSRADLAIASVIKPTIALVDGACMGGAWQLASACDFVVASERSTFAITPAKLGIIYPRSGIERLVRLVGEANAKYILFTAQTYNAVAARELGLVSETVADDAFEQRCAALIETVLQRSRFSVHTLKQLVNMSAVGNPHRDQAWSDAWEETTASPDMTIGVDAFLGHEHPQFSWK